VCCLHRRGKLFEAVLLIGATFRPALTRELRGGMDIGARMPGPALRVAVRGGLRLGGRFTPHIRVPIIHGGLLLGGEMAGASLDVGMTAGLLLGGTFGEETPATGMACGLLIGGTFFVAEGLEAITGGLTIGGTITANTTHGTNNACGNLGTAENQFTFTASGFTGAAAALNGTWVLNWVSGCTWSTGVGSPGWTLTSGTVNALALTGSWTSGGSGSSTYAITSGANGTGSNTLPHTGGINDTGHPGSITITPS
jgi:hypothetical protein